MKHDVWIGDELNYDGIEYYVDNIDDSIKDKCGELSIFILPIEYKDADKWDELFESGEFEYVGMWIDANDKNIVWQERRYLSYEIY